MTGFSHSTLAAVLVRQNKFNEAEEHLRRSLDTYAKTLPPDHQYVASSEHLLGELTLATGRLSEAEPLLTAAMNRWRRTNAAAWRSARSASALGEVLYLSGRANEAERYLTQSYRVLAADEGADRDARIKARERVKRFYTDRGQKEKLEELMLGANQPTAVAKDTGRQ
jgi:tetratricopeptide (TPR) repeat protein